MCDNIDVLLADEAGLEGEYDIGAEDEEALLEDNFDDQNLVSSSNRNYYVSREELEEEELDHEPEEPEETEESQDLDVNTSDLLDEDFDDSRKTSNPREKRNTKFVSERILPINSSFIIDELQNTNNYKKPIGKPQQQQSLNNRNKNFNNRGGRGRGFRARGRGNISSRPEAKKVLINPHFQGNTHFNIQARSPWNNNTNIGARAQPWNQQRMQPTQYMQPSIQQFQQQVRSQVYPYMQQQHQIDFQETDRMPPQQRASVHLRIGKPPPVLNQPLGVNFTSAQPQFIDQQPPQHTYQPPPQHTYQPPPQHTYEPPAHVYQLPALNNPQGMLVQQPFYNQPPPNQQQATFVTNNQYPPTMASPPQAASTFAQQPQQQLFSSPPPGYQFNQSMHGQTGCYEHQQQTQHQNVYVPQQEHGSFEFQPPPQVPQQRHVQDVHYQKQHQQQQQQLGYLQQQRRAPPNFHPDFQLPNCDLEFNSQHFNPHLNTQQINQPMQYQQERRVYVPRPNIQYRLEPLDYKQTPRNVLKQDGRFVKRTVHINRGGGSSVARIVRGNVINRGNCVISPGKRRFPPPQRGVAQRRRRTDFVNMHDTPTVDSTTTHFTGLNTAAVSVTNPAELEEDEETRQYRQKIENQKRIREKILAQKEERRRQAVLNKDLPNIAPPAELVATVISEKQSPIKTIISQPQTTSCSALSNIKRRVVNRVNTSACNNRIVTQTQAQTVQAVAVDKSEISSFLTNRRIIAKDQSLPDTAIVVISNLSAGTSEVKLRKLCQGVGNVQKLEMSPTQRQATIEFKSIASAHAFFKKYQRYMVDLSMINVVLKV